MNKVIELLEERKERLITIFAEGSNIYYGIYKGYIEDKLIIETRSMFEDEEEEEDIEEMEELIYVSIDNIIEIC